MTTTRRDFLGTAAGTGLGVLVLPNGLRAGPLDKLSLALIGTMGRGRDHHGVAANENVVALCDVDDNNMALAAKKFPGAKLYNDWRKLLDEEKKLDAVICCTTDFTHAFVTNWALKRNLHVYCEKPLANSVEEARVVRASYLAKREKLATQVGTQRHANENFNRVAEKIRDGAVGVVKDAYAWGNRQIRGTDYLQAEGSPPAHLHYDLWLGPTPYHPYNPKYFGGCLAWNKYWDFGSGQVGDMGSHTMDLAWKAMEPDMPTTAEGEGGPVSPAIAPVELHTSWEFPANAWRPAFKLHWHQGGMLPTPPDPKVELKKVDHGAMFVGTKGFLVTGFNKHDLYPLPGGDLSHYTPRPKEKQLPPMGSFQGEWIKACKSDKKTTCNFDYAGRLIETMLLGLVAYRVGKKLTYDGKAGKTNDPEADKLLKRDYRPGWTLEG